nr:ATP-binding protein [Mesorhizobium sp. LMG 17147]
MALAQGEWLKAHENLIVTGQTGTGKSWLACAFGRQAARLDHSVLYVRVPRLFEDLALACLDGRFPRLIDKLTRAQLLILDDFGTHSLTDQQRFHLFEIVEERYRRKSTLITTQVPVARWHGPDRGPHRRRRHSRQDRAQRPPHRAPGRQHAKAKGRTLLTGVENGEINHP